MTLDTVFLETLARRAMSLIVARRPGGTSVEWLPDSPRAPPAGSPRAPPLAGPVDLAFGTRLSSSHRGWARSLREAARLDKSALPLLNDARMTPVS